MCTTLGRKCTNRMYIHPSPIYIGADFDPATDIMFIAQNPGKPCDNAFDRAQYTDGLSFDERMQAYANALVNYRVPVDIANALNIPWTHAAWTNVVKCPTHENREVLLDEYNWCVPYLREQVRIIRPQVCVAIGQLAAKFFNIPLLYGVSRTLTSYVIIMPHYSRVNRAAWIDMLRKYVETVRAEQKKVAKPW